MRESVGTLRTLLMDFYPADLEARGLHASLCDLAALARTRGAAAEVDAPEAFRAPLDAEALLYRVAQEAVRNAVTHSHASRVLIRAGQERRGTTGSRCKTTAKDSTSRCRPPTATSACAASETWCRTPAGGSL